MGGRGLRSVRDTAPGILWQNPRGGQKRFVADRGRPRGSGGIEDVDEATLTSICACIQAGVSPYRAATAYGIPERTFYRWLKQGERGEPPYDEFHRRVTEAGGKAVAAAEMLVFTKNPLAWLRLGPGREDWGDHPRAAPETNVQVGGAQSQAALADLPEHLRELPENLKAGIRDFFEQRRQARLAREVAAAEAKMRSFLPPPEPDVPQGDGEGPPPRGG